MSSPTRRRTRKSQAFVQGEPGGKQTAKTVHSPELPPH